MMLRTAAGIAAGLAIVSSANAQFTLWDNGPLITHPGGHDTGADRSAISPGGNTLGSNVSIPTFRIADNFQVGSSGWVIDEIRLFAYQTGSTTTSSFTDARLQIWDGSPDDPNSNVVWGNLTDNLLAGTDWTGIYRTSSTDTSGTLRPIMYVDADLGGVSLGQGEYWIDFQMDGSLTSGPWLPHVSDPVAPVPGTALQHTSSGWQPMTDSGHGGQSAAPFIITGIPSPGALALLALGGLAAARRKR